MFSSRFFDSPAYTLRGFLGNRKVLLAIGILALLQIPFTYWTPAQTLFGTAALNTGHWGWILLSGIAVFVLVELEKHIIVWWKRKQNEALAKPRSERTQGIASLQGKGLYKGFR